jgi:prolyl-tRNA synthetase
LIKKFKKKNQILTKGIEVGHIFYFGDKYSKSLNCFVDTQDGKKSAIKMGSYGIGVSRLVGAIIEAKYNDGVMKWPKSVSPYEVVIIPNINKNNNQSLEKAMKIYEDLKQSDIDVLVDDVNENMSSKFKKHDLIGIPFQIIIGSKSLNDKFEFKEVDLEPVLLNLKEIKNKLKNKIV